jgi:hypothetical protein
VFQKSAVYITMISERVCVGGSEEWNIVGWKLSNRAWKALQYSTEGHIRSSSRASHRDYQLSFYPWPQW